MKRTRNLNLAMAKRIARSMQRMNDGKTYLTHWERDLLESLAYCLALLDKRQREHWATSTLREIASDWKREVLK